MHPTISVIVPIYNAEKYLARCIESLIHQTYCALQIILVNDGSTDNSLTIAKHYAAQDKRIEIYLQDNQGQAAARNNGLQYATGEYLSFVDADDYLDTDFYQTLYQAIGNADCVQIGYRRVTPEGRVVLTKLPRHFYQFTSPCMRLYNRTLFTQHALAFPVGRIYEDVIFSLDFWAIHPTYVHLPYAGYNYTLNHQSTTAKRNRAEEKRLFDALREKLSHAHSIKQRCIILYTIIRLKFHFKRYD